ncbi:hypothetical protein NMY22_g10514 [Coprinellus aureogranulatus]|nr:hypothetical protein NMY22_g10514 [Coprinellus aureogranulatus]
MRSGGFWFKNILAGQTAPITPSATIHLTNACLGISLPRQGGPQGDLVLEVSDGYVIPIARLQRHTHEQQSLDLTLEAGRTYSFVAMGPFPIDLAGYYKYVATDTSNVSGRSASSNSGPTSVTRGDSKKRKAAPTPTPSAGYPTSAPLVYYAPARTIPQTESADERSDTEDHRRSGNHVEEKGYGGSSEANEEFYSDRSDESEGDSSAYSVHADEEAFGPEGHLNEEAGYPEEGFRSDPNSDDEYDHAGRHLDEVVEDDDGDNEVNDVLGDVYEEEEFHDAEEAGTFPAEDAAPTTPHSEAAALPSPASSSIPDVPTPAMTPPPSTPPKHSVYANPSSPGLKRRSEEDPHPESPSAKVRRVKERDLVTSRSP